MIVLVVEPDADRARKIDDVVAASGHACFPAHSTESVRQRFGEAPRPDVLVVGARTPVSVVVCAAQVGVPVLLLHEGEGVPPELVEAGIAATWHVRGEAADLAARLEGLVARATRREEAEHARAAVQAAGAAILALDPAGIVQRANAAYARVSGGAPRDPAGTDLREILQPDGGEQAAWPFEQAARGASEWTGDATLVAGGVRVPCRTSLSPVRDDLGVVIGIVAVLVDLAEQRAREENLREANRLLEMRAWLDPLTGLYHRGHLLESLDRELARARRYGSIVSVLMIDLDDFSTVNFVLGHVGADDVLRSVAAALKGGLREGDFLARYGGDEFCAILPNTDAPAAFLVAERMRERVRAICVAPGGTVRLGASLGLATTSELDGAADSAAFLSLADKALYAAKAAGGNQVIDATIVDPTPPRAPVVVLPVPTRGKPPPPVHLPLFDGEAAPGTPSLPAPRPRRAKRFPRSRKRGRRPHRG